MKEIIRPAIVLSVIIQLLFIDEPNGFTWFVVGFVTAMEFVHFSDWFVPWYIKHKVKKDSEDPS